MDHGLIESEVIQGISTLPVGTKLYTVEQLEQAEQLGMQRIWDLLPESYQKEFRSTRDEVIKEHLKFAEDGS